MYDIRFKSNAKFLLSGPSGSGKTYFVYKLLENLNELFIDNYSQIIFVYNIYQEIYDNMKSIVQVPIEFVHNNDINIEDYVLNLENTNSTLFIIDDQMLQKDISAYTKLFTVWSRHKRLSSIFITQKLFLNDEHYRIISDNVDYIILFSNPRNLSSIGILGKQILPGESKLFKDIYFDATKAPFSHLLCDFTQQQHPFLRFRSGYFEKEGVVQVYVLNKHFSSSILDHVN